ncbi:MAG: hypothetical protein VX438_03975 [Planctomycetota bacterium]|nr:hypothetical protein [Planctomycetota bacterium]
MAQTVETHRHPAWPDSPPIQDIRFENRERAQVLLGVGMAGNSYYSVGVQSNLKDEIKFEFACHVKEQPEFIGVISSIPQMSLELTEKVNETISQDERSRIEFKSTSKPDNPQSRSELIVTPKTTYNQSDSQTLQWGFSIRF